MDPTIFLQRLASIEQELRTLRVDLESYLKQTAEAHDASVVPEAIDPIKPEPLAAPVLAAMPKPKIAHAKQPRRSNASLEALIGGRGFYAVGLLLVFLAMGFFLKIAFDQWIGPTSRVLLGFISGIALIVAAQRVKKPAFRLYADGIVALGFAIELISIYAATSLYHMVSDTLGAVALAAIIAAMSSIAFTRNSEVLAICAAVGGFLSPPLIGIVDTSVYFYTAFIALLDAMLLLLSTKREWKHLPTVLFIGSALSYAAFIAGNESLSQIVRASIAVITYFAFAFLPVMNTNLADYSKLLQGLAAVWLFIAIFSIFDGSSNHYIPALFYAAITVGQIALAYKYKRGMHVCFSLMFAGATIYDALSGTLRELSYVAEGLVGYYLGLRTQSQALRLLGAAVFVTATAALYSDLIGLQISVFLFNQRFIEFGLVAIALAFAGKTMDGKRTVLSKIENSCIVPVYIAAHAVFINALAMEAWDLAVRSAHGASSSLPDVAVSITWTACAAVLLGIGLRRKNAMFRWEGLVLIGATVIKVLSVDLASQDLIYRLISALVVGLVALAVASQYQGRIEEAKVEASESHD